VGDEAPMNNLVRRGRRVLSALVTAPPVLGALLLVLLAAIAGRRAAGDDADLGDMRRAEAMERFVSQRFGGEITRLTLGIVATAIAFGLACGLAADALLWLRYGPGSSRRPHRSFVRRLVESLLVTGFVYGALFFWSMADSPQLYALTWYARGGLLRTVQIVTTDVLGPRGVACVAMLLLVLYVRPRRGVFATRRVLAGVRRVLLRSSFLRRVTTLAALLLAGRLALAAREREALGNSVPAFGVKPPGDGSASLQPQASAQPSASSPRAPRATPSSASASNAPLTRTPESRPNILLLAADSLRADRLDPRLTPTLCRLAAEGTRFDRAYVSIPRTFPSWVTLLTGRHAHHHGIRSMFPTWEERARDFDALPARFAHAGYTTGVVSDYAGDIFGRIDLGFARVDTPSFDFRQLIRQRALERETPLLPLLHSQLGRAIFPIMRERNDAADPMLLADDITSALSSMTTSKRGGAPFFLTAFFSTAHFPYAAPFPYYAKYTDPAYRGRFKYHKPVGLGGVDAPPDAGDVAQVQALYDGAVTSIDDAVQRVLRALKTMGLDHNTIVVVTADHGETLYDNEHGQGHGDHLFGDEGTHVPLVIFDPRAGAEFAGRRVPDIARDVDLAPTLYDLAGVDPPLDLDGRSLAAALRGGALPPRFAYAESELWFTEEIPGLPASLRMPYPGILALTELDGKHNAEIVLRREMAPLTTMARHRMVRDERWKLVYVPTRRGVVYKLFDTQVDPAETHDVANEQPAQLARLKGELWSWMLRDPRMDQKDGYLIPRMTESVQAPPPAAAGASR
jgi:arylsulfatase A-like enzyme